MTKLCVAFVVLFVLLDFTECLISAGPRKLNATSTSLTWSNGSTIALNFTNRLSTKSKIVDCFGLGQTVAKALETWFTVNNDKANVLDVRFFLSSRNQRNRVQVLPGRQFGLEWTDFRVERRTVFIVHGFLSHGNETWIREMEEAFLLWDDVNLVVVDWAARGNTFNYYKAVVNTKIVGGEIASHGATTNENNLSGIFVANIVNMLELVDFQAAIYVLPDDSQKNPGAHHILPQEIDKFLHHVVNATIVASAPKTPNWGSLHLVGHSLGAHICGLASEEFKKRQNDWHVSRITGLDPAQPCFNNVSLALQLDASDAPFVDIIHTNGRLMSAFGLGLPEPIGHVDFYPNGGKRQPGCLRVQSSYFDYLPIPKPTIEQAICSHGRSYIYLTESIIAAAADNCTFWAHSWDRSYRRALQIISESCQVGNCTEMGIRAENHPQRGTFLAITSRAPPFCLTNQQDKEEVRQQLMADYMHEIQD